MVTKIKPYRIRDVNEPEEGNSLQYNDPNTFVRGEGGGGGGGSSSWGHITGTLSDQTDLQDALDEKQDELIAGDNIQIAQDGKTISATDTTYNAGEGIEIGSKTYVDTQGPCPDGFHVPTASQWSDIVNNLNGLVWNKSSCEELLKLPSAGSLSSSGTPGSISNLSYWSSSRNGVDSACELVATASGIYEPVNNGQYRACGLPIRPFKDTPVIPDNSWTQLSSGRIYRNESLGIISIRLNPLASNRWITIADKNLGATTVYNVGDEKSEANCGKYYQRGNNYGFERNVAPAKTSSVAVDASSYGPRNYYYSDTFITVSPDRSSVRNDNLWGGVSLGNTTIDNVITNMGVLSVNGETGDVFTPTDYLSTERTNSPYTPSEDYDPVTKKYVDDNALPINIPIPAAELAPVAAELFEYFQAHNGVGYPLINVNGKLYEYSGWRIDDDIITIEYISTEIEEGILYRIDHVDKIRKYKFIYTDGVFTRVESDSSWYFGGEIANGCPLWVINSSSEEADKTATFGDMAKFLNTYGISKAMGLVYDGWYYLKIHTYSTDGDYRKIIFIRLYPQTSNYNSGYSRTFRPTVYLYFTYNSETGYTYDHYDDSYIIVESPSVLATNVNYSTPYTPAYPGSPATKKYVDDSLAGSISSGATAPSSPVEGQLWYDTTNDVLKVYDGTNWNAVDTDTTYNAGEGIEIGTYNDYSAMRGPCPEGFHVPNDADVDLLISIKNTLSIDGTYFKLPAAGYISTSGDFISSGAEYWKCTQAGGTSNNFYTFDNSLGKNGFQQTYGMAIRPFKNTPVNPDSSWVTLYDGSSVATGAGVFHNAILGLISASKDGINWITISDKNLGATAVYNSGDTLTDANCGGLFQGGNNYMFGRADVTNTSSTQVDASNYGPGNYYYSSTFITGNRWDSSYNRNLRGGQTGVVTLNNAISNTGVLSVNGQTGHVTIPTAEESNTKTFYLSGTSDLTTAQAAYDWYVAGKNPIIVPIAGNVQYKTLLCQGMEDGKLVFYYFDGQERNSSSGGKLIGYTYRVKFTLSSGTVTTIEETFGTQSVFLNRDNVTAFTPTGNYNPATKKYVDDSVSGAVSKGTTAPSSPVEGQLWYDTTNDVLKVYNGTTWVEVGGGITNDTTGTTSTISQEWVGTKAEFEALSSYGDKIYNIIE